MTLNRSTPFDLSPIEARRHQQQGAVLVDVREPDEWAAGHVPGAVHIPLGQLAARLAELPPDREVLFLCASGNRSKQAAEHLRRSGHPRALNVVGGLTAWIEQGLPVER